MGSTDVTIRLFLDGGSTWELITPSVDQAVDGWPDFEWKVPDTPVPAVLIRVTDHVDAGLSDDSDAPFAIVEGDQLASHTSPIGLDGGCSVHAAEQGRAHLAGLLFSLAILVGWRNGVRRGRTRSSRSVQARRT